MYDFQKCPLKNVLSLQVPSNNEDQSWVTDDE